MHDPGVCGDCWFLKRIMRLLVRRFQSEVMMERFILKEALYRCFSWWFQANKDDTRHVLRLLVQTFDGVVYSNRGLLIPNSYLPQGGDTSGVGA